MEKSTRYQAIGLVGSLFFIFNSCVLFYSFILTWYVSNDQGALVSLERGIRILSWVGLGLSLLLFVYGGLLLFHRLGENPKKQHRSEIITALVAVALILIMAFGSVWAGRKTAGSAGNIMVTDKGRDGGGYYFVFDYYEGSGRVNKDYCKYSEYTLIEKGRKFSFVSYITYITIDKSVLQCMYGPEGSYG